MRPVGAPQQVRAVLATGERRLEPRAGVTLRVGLNPTPSALTQHRGSTPDRWRMPALQVGPDMRLFVRVPPSEEPVFEVMYSLQTCSGFGKFGCVVQLRTKIDAS